MCAEWFTMFIIAVLCVVVSLILFCDVRDNQERRSVRHEESVKITGYESGFVSMGLTAH